MTLSKNYPRATTPLWANEGKSSRGASDSGWRSHSVPQVIARAILKDPPILVLDEATSAVDNETEAAIQRSLATITQGRTTIALAKPLRRRIAHRLSTIRQADCIYVMENGQVVEQGTHGDLLAQNGIYASLWSVQSGLVSQSPLSK